LFLIALFLFKNFILARILRLTFIQKKLRPFSIIQKIEVVFHFYKIEVIFHISSIWGKIMLHTQNQLPRLPRIARIVMIPGGVVWFGGVVWWCGDFSPRQQLY
jgi:hypothetical protein